MAVAWQNSWWAWQYFLGRLIGSALGVLLPFLPALEASCGASLGVLGALLHFKCFFLVQEGFTQLLPCVMLVFSQINVHLLCQHESDMKSREGTPRDAGEIDLIG